VRIVDFLQRLDVEQNKLAHEALQKPQQGEFHYGKAVGMYAGLELAKTALLELIDEKERRDFDL
jgi:hypothetical protein